MDRLFDYTQHFEHLKALKIINQTITFGKRNPAPSHTPEFQTESSNVLEGCFPLESSEEKTEPDFCFKTNLLQMHLDAFGAPER